MAIQTPGVDIAECELRSQGIGVKTIVTQAAIVLDKSQHSVEVTCHKRCYTEGKGVITSSTEEMVAGNLIVGGAIGPVDASSGAMKQI